MRIIKIDQVFPDPLVVSEIADLLKAGAVIAFPTDTYYGLGADIYCEDAIKRVFEIKGRITNKPILILISDKEELTKLVSPENTHSSPSPLPPPVKGGGIFYVPSPLRGEGKGEGWLIDEYWPGPLTLVFKASDNISNTVTGGTGKIGIRLPDHKFCRMLIHKLGHPITATSANISGMGSLDNPNDVLTAVGDKIDILVDGGKTKGGLESTVVDVSGTEPVVLREGAISTDLIRRS
ncbi:MAG: L-threonylcarbamoyladenylate synthase [Nitrospirae bacterium]|nr:L-threonylcarbamoyladenylate synthase [Nitrospirota bacterium]